MSVVEFAELLGVDEKTVRRLERGEPANPKTLYRVSDALALDPLILFGVDEFATSNGHAPGAARAA
jgi:transcriptional regulator with XRE-family HTH domain